MNRRSFLKAMTVSALGITTVLPPLVLAEPPTGHTILRFSTSVGQLLFAIAYTKSGNNYHFDSIEFEVEKTMDIYSIELLHPESDDEYIRLNVNGCPRSVTSSCTTSVMGFSARTV